MRPLLFVLLFFGGCLATGGSGRPGVMPKLSELPGDAEKRDTILDQSGQTAGPEHRKGMTKKERKAETMAATAAAILGSAFSKTENVTLGGATTFGGGDEPRRPATTTPADGESTDAKKPPAPTDDGEPLVPWIRLK